MSGVESKIVLASSTLFQVCRVYFNLKSDGCVHVCCRRQSQRQKIKFSVDSTILYVLLHFLKGLLHEIFEGLDGMYDMDRSGPKIEPLLVFWGSFYFK